MIARSRRRRPSMPTNFALALLLAAALVGCASAPGEQGPMASEQYRKAIDNPIRTEQDRRMDAKRHPAEFLAFTQVKPGMQVLDVSAAAGYTSQLLALAVGPTGTVFAQNPRERDALTQRLADHPQANLVPVLRPFDDPVPERAPKLDLITIVQNYHDICNLPVDRAAMNARLFAALEHGGHLVVTDHSAKGGTGLADTKSLHRIDEAVVRAEIERAGFVLEAEGDFLRNPADPRDQVSYSSKIPTDKFALRFVKP
jgi:predicted methyltransferase